LSPEEQPIVISGVNIDELIVEEAQRIIADNDGSATTPQLMDEGITKILYESNVLDEMVKKYDTVVPILKKHLDYNEEGGLWTIRKSDVDEGKISNRIPVKSRLRIYIPNIVNRLDKEKTTFTLDDVINRGLYPLIRDPDTPVDEEDIIDVLSRYAQKTEDGKAWKKRLLDKYRDDLKLRIRNILIKRKKATVDEVYEELNKMKEEKEIPYAFDKNDITTILQQNFIFIKKGSRFTADLTGYLGLVGQENMILDDDLIKRLTKMQPKDFEKFVGEMVTQMGFLAEQGKYTADGGVDVKAKLETDLGSTIYAIQVKRYTKPVAVMPLRELVGVMDDFNAVKGVFVTTSRFTAPAKEYAERHNIEIIDGEKLIDLIKKYKLFGQKVGVQKKLSELGITSVGIVFLILHSLPSLYPNLIQHS
jgi:hypothetical protein